MNTSYEDGATVHRDEQGGQYVVHVHYDAGSPNPFVWSVQPTDQILCGEYEWPCGAEANADLAIGLAHINRYSLAYR